LPFCWWLERVGIQREKRTLWTYVAERRSNNHVFREQVIETVNGPMRHLLSGDGYPPTLSQMKEEKWPESRVAEQCMSEARATETAGR
jgi:hypothetical protein